MCGMLSASFITCVTASTLRRNKRIEIIIAIWWRTFTWCSSAPISEERWNRSIDRWALTTDHALRIVLCPWGLWSMARNNDNARKWVAISLQALYCNPSQTTRFPIAQRAWRLFPKLVYESLWVLSFSRFLCLIVAFSWTLYVREKPKRYDYCVEVDRHWASLTTVR